MSDPITPTGALAAALHEAYCVPEEHDHKGVGCPYPNKHTPAILAALPEGTALVTVDSLNVALGNIGSWDADGYPTSAEAVLEEHLAVKEAERE